MTGGPTPTRMSPPVRKSGAKGPTRSERESQMKRELKGSKVKKKMGRTEKIMESKRGMKKVGWRRAEMENLLILVEAEPAGLGAGKCFDWSTNLGLASSSRNSIDGQIC